VCFRVWEGGFESNNSNEMMARGAIATTNITHTVRAVDARKIMKPQYETIIDLSLLATFVAFVAFSSHLTVGKE
jgi:hypothetical protein